MLRGCTKITGVTISATKLPKASCTRMLYGCTLVAAITISSTVYPNFDRTFEWVYGVAASGTFTKPASLKKTLRGTSFIPANWEVAVPA